MSKEVEELTSELAKLKGISTEEAQALIIQRSGGVLTLLEAVKALIDEHFEELAQKALIDEHSEEIAQNEKPFEMPCLLLNKKNNDTFEPPNTNHEVTKPTTQTTLPKNN